MTDHIKEYKNSLSPEFCQHLIDLFENEPGKKKSLTRKDYNQNGYFRKDVKNSMQYNIILSTEKNDNWLKIEKHLHEELQKKLSLYITELKTSNKYVGFGSFIDNNLLTVEGFGFTFLRYIQNDGYYNIHQDGDVNWKHGASRVITFIWYLNDVSEGGETEFWENYKVKPETGKLLLFPATWSYTHKGCIPITNDKYIIAGHLSMRDKNIYDKIVTMDMKEKMDAFVKLSGGNVHESNDSKSNEEKEEVEEFRKSYERVYFV